MDKSPGIKKNYLYRLLYDILTMITPFITAPYVSRVLGADGIGIYSYTQSYMTYLSMFAVLGTASYGTREIARCRNDKYEYSKKFWEIELLTVFTTSICLLIWLGIIIFVKKYQIYFVALVPSLFAAMFDISWFYTGCETIGYMILGNSIWKLLGVVCIFLVIKNNNDLFLYILINTTMLLSANLSMWIFLPKMLIRINVKELNFKIHFKETLIYFIPTIATSIYTVLDKTLIGAITQNEYENGYYEQATKIINMAKTAVFGAVNSVMGARISFLFSENRVNEIKQRLRKSVDFILLLGFGAMFGIIGVSQTFVPVFFGEGYEAVINILYCMSPLIIIIGISNCLGAQYYTPAGLRAESAKYIIIGSFVNLIMNLIFIPTLGSIGATVASIIAELTIAILYLIRCNGYLTVNYICIVSYKRVLAGIVMSLAVYFIGKFWKNPGVTSLIVQIITGASLYFTLLFILKDKLQTEFTQIIIKKILYRGVKN